MKLRDNRAGVDYWVSYSDLMASLLLVFVLVLITALEHHSRTVSERNRTIDKQARILEMREKLLSERLQQLEVMRSTLDNRDEELLERTQKLSAADKSIAEKDRELAAREGELEAALEALSRRDAKLARREAELTRAREELASRETELEAARAALAARDAELATRAGQLEVLQQQLQSRETQVQTVRGQLATQRQRLDHLLGVRRSIVEALRQRFASADPNTTLTVDSATGAIRFGQGILFGEDEAVLRPEAEPVLRGFLNRYIGALLDSDDFRRNVSQIIIEGHTNDNGTYLHNLELSQKRALSVMTFLLAQDSPHRGLLQTMVTASGRSFSQPILMSSGGVDKVRSRRIEFKFRLREEETLRQVQSALESTPSMDASSR